MDTIELKNLTDEERQVILTGDLIPAVKTLKRHAPMLGLAEARDAVRSIRAGGLDIVAGKKVCPTCQGAGFVK